MTLSLTEAASQLRAGTLDVIDYLHSLEATFAEKESQIFSCLPEPRRWERLERQARALVEQYPDPEQRPALFGIPLGVKDIFHVDGMPTRAGSQLSADQLPGEQSAAVTQLLEAGALVFGKTVTTEFAWFGPGPTRNPHNPFHTPGGSSSGSAAAVAAGIVPGALGSQTIGSINRPAAYCGIVGYKPTYDRVSRRGVVPLSKTVDHIGCFGRNVADTELLASAMCKGWRPLEEEQQSTPTLAVPDGPYLDLADDEMRDHFEATVDALIDKGFTVHRFKVMPNFDEIQLYHEMIVAADAAEWHAPFSNQYHLYHEQTLKLIERGLKLEGHALIQARRNIGNLRNHLHMTMEISDVDLWISPPAQGAAPLGLGSTGSPIMNLPWTHAGMPTINIPTGTSANGLPLGLQLAGYHKGDESAFYHAAQIEAALAAE